MHNIYYTTILDVIIQCELGRELGGQTSLPDNNLVLVSVNDINSFMTILIIIIFSFESNQINLDLLSNEWMMQKYAWTKLPCLSVWGQKTPAGIKLQYFCQYGDRKKKQPKNKVKHIIF